MTDSQTQGLPQQIGRYEVKGVLGRGGMGRVVLGHDPVLRRDVALKLVEPQAVDQEALAELRFMFHREARATAALRHPNIIEVFDYSGPTAELMFLACELIDGPTLRAVLEQRGTLPVAIVAALGYELAEALQHAHSNNIVHRDIKPENIFWLPSGRIVLADFGIAKAVDARLGNTVRFGRTGVYGSPAYMAPEQLLDEPVGAHTDLHALGAVLYEALAGHQAFQGEEIDSILSALLASERPRLPSSCPAPPGLVGLVEQLLAKEPACRPADAAAVGRALRAALDDMEVTDPRVFLRDFGQGVESVPAAEDEGETALSIASAPASVQLPATAKPGPAASRGPFLFAMLALALALGTGAYLLTQLGRLPAGAGPQATAGPAVPSSPPASTAARQGGAAATAAPGGAEITGSEDVFALLRFAGRGVIVIDGNEVGAWDGQVRLALPAGRHRIEVRLAAGSAVRDVLLLAGSEPVFDFSVAAGD